MQVRETLAVCGLQVIDLRSGESKHWVHFSSPVEELYDVATLAGARLPKALGFQTNEIRHDVWCEEESKPNIRWTASVREKK
jgi:Domain of unknown function (DUF4915)